MSTRKIRGFLGLLLALVLTFSFLSASALAADGKWWSLNGNWYYYDAEGYLVWDGWRKIDGEWYIFKEAAMQTGWVYSGRNWYYMDASGAMATGWRQIGGNWYFFNSYGAMIAGHWYRIDDTLYYFDSSGAMATGWRSFPNNQRTEWFYFDPSGGQVTGWRQIGGKWYYFNSDGRMATGEVRSGNRSYYMSDSGAMVTGWQRVFGSWHYYDDDGAMHTGWLQSGGKWYYFTENGTMAVDCQLTIDGRVYTFDANGVLIDTSRNDSGAAVSVRLRHISPYITITGYDTEENVVWNITEYTGPNVGPRPTVTVIGVLSDRYYYANNDNIVALDLATGTEIWRNTELGSNSVSTPMFTDEGILFLCGWDTDLFGVDVTSGRTVVKIVTLDPNAIGGPYIENITDEYIEIGYEYGGADVRVSRADYSILS